MTEKGTIILSAGGTGGHVMPALALAAALRDRGYASVMATDARGARFREMAQDVPFHVLEAGTPAGGVIAKLRGGLMLGRGTVQAIELLRRIRPSVVVGFGGYPSVPAVAAARVLGMPIVLHEANAVLGKANRFLAGGAAAVALSHGGRPEDGQDAARTFVTGNPVRPEFAEIRQNPYPALTTQGPLRILVTGGSLGAEVFGRVVPEALTGLPEALRARVGVVQQCVADDIPKVRETYEKAGIRAWIEPFFADLPDQVETAHLVISRSGASTVSELTVAGRPAIFVPYPHHADQQQKANAKAIEVSGGAWVIEQADFTPQALRARIESFMQEPQILVKAAAAARSCGTSDAAGKLADLVTQIAQRAEKDRKDDEAGHRCCA